jgi:hypothetical protein
MLRFSPQDWTTFKLIHEVMSLVYMEEPKMAHHLKILQVLQTSTLFKLN